MARSSADDPSTPAVADPQADWEAQVPCSECGGRPGRNPATGQTLRIKLPNADWCDGHTYNCMKRPQ